MFIKSRAGKREHFVIQKSDPARLFKLRIFGILASYKFTRIASQRLTVAQHFVVWMRRPKEKLVLWT